MTSFTKVVNPQLAKHPLVFNGHLPNRGFTPLIKESTGLQMPWWQWAKVPSYSCGPNFRQILYTDAYLDIHCQPKPWHISFWEDSASVLSLISLLPYHKFKLWIYFYYTPVWKTDVLCRGNVRPSVRLSVLPSVQVFRTFLQHALRYRFETWYIHSVGGTTCRVRVASQLGHFDLVYSQK